MFGSAVGLLILWERYFMPIQTYIESIRLQQTRYLPFDLSGTRLDQNSNPW